MKIRSKIIAAALITGMSVAASPASAAAVIWTIQNGTFDDGATFSGSFTYDTAANKILTFNVVTGNGKLSGFEYTPETTGAYFNQGAGPNSLIFFAVGEQRYLNIAFLAPLSSGLTTHDILPRIAFECRNCSPVRYVSSGSITSHAVPEPASWAMMISGLGLVGATLRRRKASISFA